MAGDAQPGAIAAADRLDSIRMIEIQQRRPAQSHVRLRFHDLQQGQQGIRIHRGIVVENPGIVHRGIFQGMHQASIDAAGKAPVAGGADQRDFRPLDGVRTARLPRRPGLPEMKRLPVGSGGRPHGQQRLADSFIGVIAGIVVAYDDAGLRPVEPHQRGQADQGVRRRIPVDEDYGDHARAPIGNPVRRTENRIILGVHPASCRDRIRDRKHTGWLAEQKGMLGGGWIVKRGNRNIPDDFDVETWTEPAANEPRVKPACRACRPMQRQVLHSRSPEEPHS